MKILSATFICGALILVADATVQAQSGPAPTGVPATGATVDPVTPKEIGPLEAWADKPLGKYDIVINIPEGAMPVEITVNEAASGLSATFYKVGDNDAHTMTAAVNGTDLVLK